LKLSDIKRGYAAMNAGVWVDNIPLPLFEGVRLQVRRLWNPDFAALWEKLTDGKPDPLPDADQRAVMTQCLAQTVLIGWDGTEDVYSPAAALALLSDDEADGSNPVRMAVIRAANSVADRVKAQLEADEKNSATP